MQYFIISLVAGSLLLAILLTVFFRAGKKSKKQRHADLQLVKDCGDESLLRLYEQADSENERDGIVEFIKEKMDQNEPVIPVAQVVTKAVKPPDPSETAASVSQNTAYGDPSETHMLALEEVDWQAIEQDLQQKREEEARIMAQNQQIQEVFSKIREVEERLIPDQEAKNDP